MAQKESPRQFSRHWTFNWILRMDKYTQLSLALSAILLALVVPLYYPVDQLRHVLSFTLINMDDNSPLVLPKLETFSPKVRFMSYDPLIAHLHDFISLEERRYLMKLAKPMLYKSRVALKNGTRATSQDRTSSTAFLPKQNTVVNHILERASEFQGYLPVSQMDMQVTAYEPGQQYRAHYDWFPQPTYAARNRFSTFFAILEANCDNCGTQFTQIVLDPQSLDQRWCKHLNCSENSFTTLNHPGDAVFWRNLDPWGRPRNDVMHAGLPAINGSKIGLNIWTEIPVNPEWYPKPEAAENAESSDSAQSTSSNQQQGDGQDSQQQPLAA